MGIDSEELLCPVYRWTRSAPHSIAATDKSGDITFAELDNLINAAADGLLAEWAGPASSLSVGLVVGPAPSLDTMVAVLAVLRLGGRIALLNERLGADLLGIQAEIADVKLLSPSFNIRSPKTLRIARSVLGEWAPSSTLVIFTSGSEGAPRGVVHSTFTIAAHLKASTARLNLGTQSCWMVSLPCFHVGGLLIPLRIWWCGGRCLFSSNLQRTTLVETLEKYPFISHVSLVPQMLEEILRLPQGETVLRSCQVVLLGGAPLSSSSRKKILERQLPVWVGYGSSEFCSHITLGPLSAADGGSGHPIDGATIFFNADGQIGADFPALFLGYCGEEKRDPGLPYWSSDCGEFSRDGELIVLGRVDRVIISGGEKIDPHYVEEVVMKHLAAMGRDHRCAVLGFPDQKWGERPVLFVEQGRGVADTFSDLQTWQTEIETCVRDIVSQHLPRLFRPEIVITIPQFPVTALGKIAFGELRVVYRDRNNS